MRDCFGFRSCYYIVDTSQNDSEVVLLRCGEGLQYNMLLVRVYEHSGCKRVTVYCLCLVVCNSLYRMYRVLC